MTPAPKPTSYSLRSRITDVATTTLLGVAVVIVLLLAIGSIFNLWHVDPVLSESMRPAISAGDDVIVTKESVQDLSVGQIIVFHPPPPFDTSELVVHRVIQIDRSSGSTIVRTKGDANNAPDLWRAKLEGNTVWRVQYVVPLIGYLAVWWQQTLVRAGILLLIVIVIVLEVLRRVWAQPENKTKSEPTSPPSDS